MKRFGLMLVMILLFTACGPAPTPAPTQDVQATALSLSGTMLASTLTAQPSVTPLPSNTPLPTDTPTLAPTETPLAPAETPTLAPDLLATATLDPSLPGLPTATAWSGTLSPGNTDGLPTGLLRIENYTGVKGVIVTLTGVTMTREQPVYYSYLVDGSLNLKILWARYQYVIQVPNKKIFKGTFGQNSKDKTTMKIYLDKGVVILGP
jgi:hypothetical protein